MNRASDGIFMTLHVRQQDQKKRKMDAVDNYNHNNLQSQQPAL